MFGVVSASCKLSQVSSLLPKELSSVIAQSPRMSIPLGWASRLPVCHISGLLTAVHRYLCRLQSSTDCDHGRLPAGDGPFWGQSSDFTYWCCQHQYSVKWCEFQTSRPVSVQEYREGDSCASKGRGRYSSPATFRIRRKGCNRRLGR